MLSAAINSKQSQSDLPAAWVILIENDLLQATDLSRTLEDAGLGILGPCATAQEALNQLKLWRPDAALLNLAYGSAVSFELATFLRAEGIPFAFLIGYESGTIPAEFADVERLEKPIASGQVIDAIGRMIG